MAPDAPPDEPIEISIHTPVKGVTAPDAPPDEPIEISIHTPVKGVTVMSIALTREE